jgi:hypothetical protein
MRIGLYLFAAALVVSLAVAVTTKAQQTAPAESFFTGVNPKNIKFVPVDVTSDMKTFNVSQAFRTSRPPAPFTLSQLFPKISFPSWPLKKAATPILAKSPFQTITPVLPSKKK